MSADGERGAAIAAGMGALCTHSSDTVAPMSKVIQIRDVPDDVHRALVAAAEDDGLSLTKFALRELERVAARSEVVRHNAAVIRRAQRKVRGKVDRATILEVIHEGRGE